MKKYFIFILLTIFLSACDSETAISGQEFKQLIDMNMISLKINDSDQKFLVLLDNQINQLYFYDMSEKCFFDFEKTIPNNNGLIVEPFPYKTFISDDNRKAAVLSSSKVLTIVDIDPLKDYYQLDCVQSVLPFIEAQYKLNEIPSEVFINKSAGFDYNIDLVYNSEGKVENIAFTNKVFTKLNTKIYQNSIESSKKFNNELYISVKNEAKLFKYNSTDEDEEIIFNDKLKNPQITDFIVTADKILLFNKPTKEIFIWSIEKNDFLSGCTGEENENKLNCVSGYFDPLTTNENLYPYSFKLNDDIYSMNYFKRDNFLKEGDFLNGLGYLLTNQLLEGEYIVINDMSGYTYYLTLSTDMKNIVNSNSEEVILDDYKKALEKRFVPYQIPLITDYSVKVNYINQSAVCTQYNKQEADSCFSLLNEESEVEYEKYITIKDEIKNRIYSIKEETFYFRYEDAIPESMFIDGTFENDTTFSSVSIDFSALNIPAEKLQLEILSQLSDDKKTDTMCSSYVDSESIKIPLTAINNHSLTLNNTDFANLNHCFEEAVVFQIKAKDHFILEGSKSGYLDIIPFCTNSPEVFNGKRLDCVTENAIFENELFKVKLFSDKAEIEEGSYISFAFYVASTELKYSYSVVSPFKSLTYNEGDKQYILILDTYNNLVVKVDFDKLGTVNSIID